MNTSGLLPLFVIAAVLVIVSTVCSPRLRGQIVFPFANLVLLAWMMPNLIGLTILFIFIGVSYGFARLMVDRAYLSLVPSITILIFIFAYFKKYPVIELLPFSELIPSIVGLAYILIRSLQVIIDYHQYPLAVKLTFWRFINFLLAWPTLLSGPIMSYQDFCLQWDLVSQQNTEGEELYLGFSRAIWGLISVIIFADIFRRIFDVYYSQLVFLTNIEFNKIGNVSKDSFLFNGGLPEQFFIGIGLSPEITDAFVINLAVCTISYLLYLYFNFAGYTSIVIGLGRMCGWSIPENFNYPWASRNALDLWSRWHITLANWFRTYVFNGLMKFFLRRWQAPAQTPYFAVAAFFITFFLVGIWHGPTLNFVLCGLALGVSVSVNKLWQIKCIQWFGKKKYDIISSNRIYRFVSSGFAIAFFSFSVIPFWMGIQDMAHINTILGLQVLLKAGILAVIFFTLTSSLAMTIEKSLEGLCDCKFSPFIPGLGFGLAIIYAILFSGGIGEFVYQRF